MLGRIPEQNSPAKKTRFRKTKQGKAGNEAKKLKCNEN